MSWTHRPYKCWWCRPGQDKQDLSRILPTNSKRNKDGRNKYQLGIFHKLAYEMRTALLKVAKDDAPIAQKQDKAALQKQRAEKHRKEELLSEHGVNKASIGFY